MRTPTLHDIHDPLCGWCDGTAPQVADGELVQRHIAQTRALMQRLGVHGFPGWLQGQLGPLQPHGMPGLGRAGSGGLA